MIGTKVFSPIYNRLFILFQLIVTLRKIFVHGKTKWMTTLTGSGKVVQLLRRIRVQLEITQKLTHWVSVVYRFTVILTPAFVEVSTVSAMKGRGFFIQKPFGKYSGLNPSDLLQSYFLNRPFQRGLGLRYIFLEDGRH